jgi:hypothetical protein
VARPPVVRVEVAAFGGREEERRRAGWRRDLVERVECGPLKRYGAGRLGLGGLQAIDAEGSADVDEALLAVDVAVLERNPFAGASAGGGGEQDHRPVARPELGGERRELAVGLKWAHLAARRMWVVDAGLGRVGVDQAPLACSSERLPEGLGGFDAVSGGECHPPGGDRARVELRKRRRAERRR